MGVAMDIDYYVVLLEGMKIHSHNMKVRQLYSILTVAAVDVNHRYRKQMRDIYIQ